MSQSWLREPTLNVVCAFIMWISLLYSVNFSWILYTNICFTVWIFFFNCFQLCKCWLSFACLIYDFQANLLYLLLLCHVVLIISTVNRKLYFYIFLKFFSWVLSGLVSSVPTIWLHHLHIFEVFFGVSSFVKSFNSC